MNYQFQNKLNLPVLVIGSAGLDIVGRIEHDLVYGTSNPSRIRSSFGGSARNIAENLALLGQDVNFLSAVGRDEQGEKLLEKLAKDGVNVDSVMRSDRYPTGAYLAVVNENGELQIGLDDMRISQEISPEYIQKHEDLFASASMLFIDANLPKATIRKIFSLARKAKVPVSADPTSITLAERLKPVLSKLFLVTPNCAEASVLCGREYNQNDPQTIIEAAKCLVGLGVEIAIVTMAQFGVCYATSETNGHISAIHTEIVDPTGGGDALSAAVIFSLVNGLSLDDAIRLGVSAAALTLRANGTVLDDLSLEKLYDQLVI